MPPPYFINPSSDDGDAPLAGTTNDLFSAIFMKSGANIGFEPGVGTYFDLGKSDPLDSNAFLRVTKGGNLRLIKQDLTTAVSFDTSLLTDARTHKFPDADGTFALLETLGTLATQNGTFSGTSSGTNTGDQTITLTGDVTGTGTGSFATTLGNAPVIAKVLTGYSSGAGTVASTDTILQAFQKLNGNDGLKAPLASPTLTGTPAAPTASVDTNTTQLSTTAFVLAQAAAATPLVDGTAAVGTSTRYARADHVHPLPNIPQNSKSAAYTTVLADAQKHILHPTADDNARTFLIDSNANVAYPIGTAITFVNQINTVTIDITSDTLTLAGAGTTGSRTLAANGMATALKIGTTAWIINGSGLT